MVKRDSAPPEKQRTAEKVGKKAHVAPLSRGSTWVQTERAAHEAWARLTVRKPLAAAVMHHLVARMGQRNAIVVSQKTLAKLVGVTDRSIRSAVQVLEEERWLQVVQLNGPGTVSAYVINSVVAWSQSRENLHTAAFAATVLADAEDQKGSLDHRQLRQVPMLYPSEMQLPSGPGDTPPSQQLLPGLEPDLPHRTSDGGDL